MMEDEKDRKAANGNSPYTDATIETIHGQQLDHNFSLLSICATGLVVGNTWAALGGSITIAIYNGGPAWVIYEL